jgi:hypothetical protein
MNGSKFLNFNKMNSSEYDKVNKDIRTVTQKIANDIFIRRRAAIMKALNEHTMAIDEEKLAIKKGRPKK